MQAAKPAAVDPSVKSDPGRRTVERRAVEAAIWGMPLVSMDAMRQAFLRDARARYHDIVYMSRPADWRFQVTTANAAFRYVFIPVNTRSGAVVIDIPPIVGAELFGTINDAWHVPVADIGPTGRDAGRGGRYVLLPPGSTETVRDGQVAVPMQTYNGYALLRAIPASPSPADVEQALALVTGTRVYPLREAGSPPPQRFIDMAGTLLDGIAPLDDTFYDSLARMVDEEPVQEHDLVAMAQLRSIGIEKGRPFRPDAPTRAVLARAIVEARAGFIQAMRDLPPFYQERRWAVPVPHIGDETGHTFATSTYLDVDARGQLFFFRCAPAKEAGAATLSLVTLADADGGALDGGRRYRLHVPPDVPARQFWTVTVYDCETAAFVREAASIEVSSQDERLQRGADGSVEVAFGASPPDAGANWLTTAPGRPFMAVFRLYGAEPAAFDQTWMLPDLEQT